MNNSKINFDQSSNATISVGNNNQSNPSINNSIDNSVDNSVDNSSHTTTTTNHNTTPTRPFQNESDFQHRGQQSRVGQMLSHRRADRERRIQAICPTESVTPQSVAEREQPVPQSTPTPEPAPNSYISKIFGHVGDTVRCQVICDAVAVARPDIYDEMILFIGEYSTGELFECFNELCDNEINVTNGLIALCAENNIDTITGPYFKNPELIINGINGSWNINKKIDAYCEKCTSLLSPCGYNINKYNGPYCIRDGVEFNNLYCNSVVCNNGNEINDKCNACNKGKNVIVNGVNVYCYINGDNCCYDTTSYRNCYKPNGNSTHNSINNNNNNNNGRWRWYW